MQACGGRASVQAGQLLSGKTKSCGCLVREGRCGRPFTRKAARQAHKATARILVDGEWLFAPREAARYLGVSYPTLIGYANQNASGEKKGCPWLGGQAIPTRLLPTAYNRKIRFFPQKALDRVNDARAERVTVPVHPGSVHVVAAAEDLGVSVRTLRRRLQECASRGVKATPKDLPAKSIDGRALPRSYVPAVAVKACVSAQEKKRPPDSKITVREAATTLKLRTVSVHALIRRGVLKAEIGTPVCKGGYLRKGTILDREEVERYKKRRERKAGPHSSPDPTAAPEPMGSASRESAADRTHDQTLSDLAAYPSRLASVNPQAAADLHKPLIDFLDNRLPPAGGSPRVHAAPERPRWDPDRRELWFGEQLVKSFNRNQSPHAVKLLNAFDESGWPAAIDDPLDPGKLAEVLPRFKDWLLNSPLVFERNGTGEQVCWRRREATPQ